MGPLNFKAGENWWSKNWTYPYFAVRSIEHTFFLSLITTQDWNYIPVFLLSWSITATKHLCFYEFLFRKGCSRGVARIFQKGEGGGEGGPHHPGIADYMSDYIWFIPLLSLVYQRAQSYYRGMKAHNDGFYGQDIVMAFSPPEYCRWFAQKKAYEGGHGDPRTPPGKLTWSLISSVF